MVGTNNAVVGLSDCLFIHVANYFLVNFIRSIRQTVKRTPLCVAYVVTSWYTYIQALVNGDNYKPCKWMEWTISKRKLKFKYSKVILSFQAANSRIKMLILSQRTLDALQSQKFQCWLGWRPLNALIHCRCLAQNDHYIDR